MAEQFLTLMADLDGKSQEIMGSWYAKLKEAGFTGVQTPGLPFHISLATFALDQEEDAARETRRLAEVFAPVAVHISHIGLFAGGKVLFGAPDMNPPELLDLRNAIQIKTEDPFGWTPHATVLIDEAETVQKALPVLVKEFRPFVGKIDRLHLCAFWPTREIASFKLVNSKKE